MSLTPITDLKRELATLRELREYDAAIIAKLRLELDAALAALRDLFEHCSMIHNKWGEGCNQKQADAAIQQARAVIAASQGS